MDDLDKLPIFDGHNDVFHKLYEQDGECNAFFTGREGGHLDYPRAKRVGFAGGLFAIYVPNPPSVPDAKSRLRETPDGYQVEIAPPLDYSYAHRTALDMIQLAHRLVEISQGKMRLVKTTGGVKDCLCQGSMAAVLHLEGAEPIHPSLSNLETFYQLGVRSLGITWSRENAFGHGVPFEIPASPDIGPGLSPAGVDLVQACNDMGILIDLAHLNERGFWDIVGLSGAPLVASHTAAHALVPRSRNLTDEQMRAIADSDGLVGVTFSVNDLDGGKKPKEDADPQVIIRHMQYIADLIGVDHVAFGSDLDGTTIPSDVGDVTGFPKILNKLENAGFTGQDLEKICYRNWLRVLEETWQRE